jgi:hypothetical protein
VGPQITVVFVCFCRIPSDFGYSKAGQKKRELQNLLYTPFDDSCAWPAWSLLQGIARLPMRLIEVSSGCLTVHDADIWLRTVGLERN